MGFRILSFEEKAARVAAMPTVSSVVRKGIDDADIVIVLFTPDELAVLYDSATGLPMNEPFGDRWQARPNVIFEAGWAFGLKPSHTLFATVSDETTLFSDVGGFHVVQLDRPGSSEALWSRLKRLFPNRMTSAAPPDSAARFSSLSRRRWRFHDELGALHTRLANIDIKVGKKNVSLLEIIRGAVAQNRSWTWSERSPSDLIDFVKRRRNDRVADETFWWLATTGFFQFSQIEHWGDHWEDSIDYATFARRGLALLEWLARHRG